VSFFDERARYEHAGNANFCERLTSGTELSDVALHVLVIQFNFMNMKNTPRNQQEDFLCDFLKKMLDATDNKQEVERAINTLNDSLYEYGFDLSMVYDHRDGSASIVG